MNLFQSQGIVYKTSRWWSSAVFYTMFPFSASHFISYKLTCQKYDYLITWFILLFHIHHIQLFKT